VLFLPEKSLAENVFCFTTSVHGGVSNAAYKSFNLGMHVGDNELRVATNRQLLNAIIKQQVINRTDPVEQHDIAPVAWLNQQHSNIVREYAEMDIPFQRDINNIISDGVYTCAKYTPLAIMTADCLPIIIVCSQSGRLSAIHAGWRGLLSGILSNAVDKFNDKSFLSVWIGPSISQAHFQISQDIVGQFEAHKYALKKDGNDKGKYLVDLAQIAQKQLLDLGVVAIQKSSVCTYASEHCFSHRQARHQGLENTGRMATIVLSV
jgi:YfiH family protein